MTFTPGILSWFGAIVVGSLTLLTGCKKDEGLQPAPQPLKLLSIDCDENFDPNVDEGWVIVNDRDGKLLEYKQLVRGESSTLETAKSVPGGKVTVTLLSRSGGAGVQSIFSLKSYVDVQAGTDWSFSPRPSKAVVDGQIQFTVHNCPTDRKEFRVSAVGITSIGFYTSGSEVTGYAQHHAGMDKYLVSIMDKDNELHYKFFNNIQSGGTIETSFNDLGLSTNIAVLNVGPIISHSLSVAGLEEGQQFTEVITGHDVEFHLSSSGEMPATLKAHYLAELPMNRLSVGLTYHQNKSFRYQKFGGPPSAFSIPGSDEFAVTNTTLGSFAMSNSPAFNFRQSEWAYTSNDLHDFTTWDFYSSSTTQKFVEFPDEIATHFPKLNVTDLVYMSTDLYLQSITYDELLQKIRGPHFYDYDLFGTESLYLRNRP